LSWKFVFFLCLVLTCIVAAPAVTARADPPGTVDFELTALHDPDRHSGSSRFLAEVVKQAAEQPLHFVMSAGPIWLSRCLTAVPWYGWAMVPALAYREWRQWPSKRWWDPPLDAAFLLLGAITATWTARLGPFPLPALRRRGWRAATWRRGEAGT
jgi:hypothetical protein